MLRGMCGGKNALECIFQSVFLQGQEKHVRNRLQLDIDSGLSSIQDIFTFTEQIQLHKYKYKYINTDQRAFKYVGTHGNCI